MPTYDYVCAACEYRLEIFQPINTPVKRKCPACGKNRLQRQIGAGAGILFKGSGFYETDYRSSEYKKRAAQEQKESSPQKSDKSGDKEGSGSKKSKETPGESRSSALDSKAS